MELQEQPDPAIQTLTRTLSFLFSSSLLPSAEGGHPLNTGTMTAGRSALTPPETKEEMLLFNPNFIKNHFTVRR